MRQRICSTVTLGIVCGMTIWLFLPTPAAARKSYLKTFQNTYLDKNDNTSELALARCYLCHEGKRSLNRFGEDILTEMERKGEWGLSKKTLADCMQLPSQIKNKSYLDLIKDKKLPTAKDDHVPARP